MIENISFLISISIESKDRLNNLDLSVDNLLHNFPNCEVILSEIDSSTKIKNRYPKCKHIFTQSSDMFNKQRGFNIAAKASTKDFICLYDADVILKKRTVNKTIELLRSNDVDIIYPYNGYFYDVPKQLHQIIFDSKSLDYVNINDCKLLSDRSVGGAVFYKKTSFWLGGGSNENFKGVGYEDNELFERFKKLGFRIGRINSPLFHLTHERKETSFDYNPHGNYNQKEFLRIVKMNKEQLLEEIKNWKK